MRKYLLKKIGKILVLNYLILYSFQAQGEVGKNDNKNKQVISSQNIIQVMAQNPAFNDWNISSLESGLEIGINTISNKNIKTDSKFIIDTNGNLEIAGALITNGKNLNIPDYVFEPNYKLMPLSKLDSYVRKNKHLPKISSAREINSSGKLNMTQMQLRLLEKIEELTLYTLKQHRINEKQQQIINRQEKTISRNSRLIDTLEKQNKRYTTNKSIKNKQTKKTSKRTNKTTVKQEDIDYNQPSGR